MYRTTAGDRTNFADAMDVINSYSLKEKLPASVLHHLQRGGRLYPRHGPNPTTIFRMSTTTLSAATHSLQACTKG